jgi:selenocysteine lyase/cysteine desulfurase
MPQIKEQILNSQASNIVISVSAASNVTSKLTDLNQINAFVSELRKGHTKSRVIFAADCAAFTPHHELNLK